MLFLFLSGQINGATASSLAVATINLTAPEHEQVAGRSPADCECPGIVSSGARNYLKKFSQTKRAKQRHASLLAVAPVKF